MSDNPQQLHWSSATEKFLVSIIIEIPPIILIKKRLVITVILSNKKTKLPGLKRKLL
jgi:hypothetical protein